MFSETKEEYDKRRMQQKAKILKKETGMKYTEALREVKKTYVSDYVAK